jgi:hypothetical protein
MLNAAGRSGDLVPKLIAEAITTSFEGKQKPEYSSEWKLHAAAVSDIDDYLDPLDLKDDQMPDTEVEHVVIVMHGIRDDGFWAKRISREIKTLYRAQHTVDQARYLRTVTPSYGFFSMWDFLFPGGRTKALYWFLDKYADIRRLYPCVTKIDLIAHSNGTYLGAQTLRECKNVYFRRMLFAGSVVRRDFWMESIEKLSEKLESFHSFIGREDFVVALLPEAMETIPLLGKLLNVGGAGAFGFIQLPHLGKNSTLSLPESSCMNRLGFCAPQKQMSGKEPWTATQRMIKGGHGAAIQEESWKTIASFIVEGPGNMEEILDRQDRSDPTHALRRVSRGRASTLMLAVARVCIGFAIVPCLLFLLLFPAWYPFLILAGHVPAVNIPALGAFPLMISALAYSVLVVLVWILYNGLRYL